METVKPESFELSVLKLLQKQDRKIDHLQATLDWMIPAMQNAASMRPLNDKPAK